MKRLSFLKGLRTIAVIYVVSYIFGSIFLWALLKPPVSLEMKQQLHDGWMAFLKVWAAINVLPTLYIYFEAKPLNS